MNNTSQTSPKIDLEQLLRDGNIIRIKPQGYSMYPLFIPGRDEALIQQTSSTDCRRNDVVLYRRDRSILVLHRIDKITEEGFFMVGDNQWEIEGPLRSDQIIGKLVAFVRNGREISAQNPFYRFLSSVWLLMLPVRPFCFRLTAFFRRICRKPNS
ncbi:MULTISPECIES: S24/S26 family peptidase [Blautia]|uniref:S24/S26 family peptidase n=1 Tax=Blautia aquisgranensis TaxID=3133153 RepID=A0ABV1BHI8_9FIRM|nr:S24/S26 family peptidase [Blautia massiliensis (ex Durand et al. 2017)]